MGVSRYNSEGYLDPTAFFAVRSMEQEKRQKKQLWKKEKSVGKGREQRRKTGGRKK